MSKLKTHKAVAKRFTITKGEKIKQRKAGQDHFNARETGKVKRNKRRDINTHQSIKKNIMASIPYN